MEIKIRGVDVGAVKVLDDLAKKNKMSRNEYLKRQLETLAWLDKIQAYRNRFEETVSESVAQFRYVEAELENQKGQIRRLTYLLMSAMDVTEEELDQIERFMSKEGEFADD